MAGKAVAFRVPFLRDQLCCCTLYTFQAWYHYLLRCEGCNNKGLRLPNTWELTLIVYRVAALFANQATHLIQDRSNPSPFDMQRIQHIFALAQRNMSCEHLAVAFNIIFEVRVFAESHGM